MTNTTIAAIWGGLYVLCAAFGVFSVPGWLGITACIAFFVPPILLIRSANVTVIRRVRNISLIWLGFTMLMIIANIASVAAGKLLGTVLYYAMAVLCAPMVCGKYWLLSLFLFAFVLMYSLQELRKLKH